MIPNLGRDMTTAELREVDMTLNEYQHRSRETAVYASEKNQNLTDHIIELCEQAGDFKLANFIRSRGLVYSNLALGGEVGELANKLKKHLRNGTTPNVEVLADELGDVLWYVASVAHEMGLNLESIAKQNLAKLAERKAADKLKEHK